MKLDTEDPRLRKSERRQLREIALRLQAMEPRQRQPLPESYRLALEECFGPRPDEGRLRAERDAVKLTDEGAKLIRLADRRNRPARRG
jgi:hypothetical protein